MGDNAFKDYPMNIKMPGALRGDIETIASALHVSPPALARALMEEFVRASKSYGQDVAWPPVFMRRTGDMIPARGAQPSNSPLIYARAEHPRALVADRPGTSHAKRRG